jgi:hypothetical protein
VNSPKGVEGVEVFFVLIHLVGKEFLHGHMLQFIIFNNITITFDLEL